MKKSGWRSAAMRRGRPPAELPIVPTQWEGMLNANGWTDEQAIASPVAKALARKLLLNKRYIPEVVLMAWGWTEWL